MKTSLVRFLAALLVLLGSGVAQALDTSPATPDKLGEARARIAEKNWPAALAELRKVNDSGNADWNNLMGYALRKSDPGSYGEAARFYDEALRIDPRHRGALEYSGELFLMTGNLALAEQRLAALDKACFLPCEEYTDLKRAVARFKAAGNRYVPE